MRVKQEGAGNPAERQEAARALAAWLRRETGRAPRRLRCVDSVQLHFLRYYLFKYKRSFFSRRWLLGVCGGYRGEGTRPGGHLAGGIPHLPQQARADATRMVEECRMAILRRARGIEEQEEAPPPEVEQLRRLLSSDADRHAFSGSVLLRAAEFDARRLCDDLQREWDLPVSAARIQHAGSVTFDFKGLIAAVTLAPEPVADGEAEQYAVNNFRWPDAARVAAEHTAHLQLAVLGMESAFDTAALFTRLAASCLNQPAAVGLCAAGTVFRPEFYRAEAQLLREGGTPVRDWIYVGLSRSREGLDAYTYGMTGFGYHELEILGSALSEEELEDLLCELARYALSTEYPLHSGECLGFCEGEIYRLSRSPGVSVDGVSMKLTPLPKGPEPGGA